MNKLSNNIIKANELISDYNYQPADWDTEDVKKMQLNFQQEQERLYYVQTGNSFELEKHWDNNQFIINFNFAKNPLNSAKYLAIYTISTAYKAATAGGVDTVTGYLEMRRFISKLENMVSEEEVFLLIQNIYMTFCHLVAEANTLSNYSPIIIKIMQYVQRGIGGKVNVKVIAELLHISPNHLSSLFKKETGINLSDYIVQQKISRAKLLLKSTDKSISEIATELDYSTQSHFQKQFKIITGLTPLDFRNKTV